MATPGQIKVDCEKEFVLPDVTFLISVAVIIAGENKSERRTIVVSMMMGGVYCSAES